MLQVAVIGAGHWGPNLVRNFHTNSGAQVRYVVDVNPKRLDLVRVRYPEVGVLTDPAAAIDDPAVGAVVIATPTSTHHALCRRALLAGKHVLVEKPLAASVPEAEELANLADEKKLTLLVGHVFLYNVAVQRVKKLVADGALGRVYYVSMVRTNLGPIRIDVNAAWDLAAHDISMANYWLGSAPVTASGIGRDYINRGVEDVVFAVLRYPNDVLVNLHCSWLNPRKSRDVTVVGDRKMLTFDDMNLQEPLRLYDKGVADQTVPGIVDTFASFRASVREGDITIPNVPAGEPLKAECDHFVECVVTGQRPLTDGQSAVAVVRALSAIQRSVKAGGREETVS